MKKVWHIYIYIMKYYSVMKSKIMPFAETWMDLETIKQSEISQKEKNKCCVLTHICRI